MSLAIYSWLFASVNIYLGPTVCYALSSVKKNCNKQNQKNLAIVDFNSSLETERQEVKPL